MEGAILRATNRGNYTYDRAVTVALMLYHEGGKAVEDHELKQARNAIPALLDSISAEGNPALTVSQVVERLKPQGIGEEAARLTIWYLVDRGTIEFTSDWRVRTRHSEVSAR
jgi:hypothetical protein